MDNSEVKEIGKLAETSNQLDLTFKKRITTVLWPALLLVVMTAAAYVPATKCGYIWDDDFWLTRNPLVSAPEGLWQIWFSYNQPSQYFPMVYTTFHFEYALWGLNPAGYHTTNIVLHVINALLLWWLLSKLKIPGAWLAATIFALHPVHVESVVWITERKNVLVALFSLLSLLAWIVFAEHSHTSQRSWPFYLFSLLLYTIALLSKTTACTLPAGLVLLLWIKRIRLSPKRWLQIVPYVILGLAMGLLTMWWERHHQGTDPAVLGLSVIERVIIASRAIWFYIGKLILPLNLTFSYPQWKIDVTNPFQYSWLCGCLIVAWSIWHWRAKLGCRTIAAIIFFVATLSPMLGFLSLYTFFYTYVADHYQYVASIGPIALVAAVGYRIGNRLTGIAKDISIVVLFLALATLGTLTRRQCQIYKNPETLWRDTLRKNPSSWLANSHIGSLLKARGKLDEAADYYRQAVRIKPDYIAGYNNLGNALLEQGKLDEAIICYRKALQIEPDLAKTHFNLGNALRAKGKLDEALCHYHKALQTTPNDADVHINLGVTLTAQGAINEAFTHFRQAVRLKPNSASAHYNLGRLLGLQGNIDEAVKHLDLVLQIEPDSIEVQKLKKTFLSQKGEFE